MIMDRKRYHFIDNIRWVVVLLVLLYHVFYNYNALGVFGAIGSLGDNQWQDIICTLLNPWFMPMLFVIAGASSKYALEHQTTKEFRIERRRKLLIPSTLGILIFGWILGMINMANAGIVLPEGTPGWVTYLISLPSGIAHLWFIQDLFGFSLLLLIARKWIDVKQVDNWLTTLPKYGITLVMMAIFGVLYATSLTQIDDPSAAMGLFNLYRPIFYFVVFIMGYYIFSSEAIHNYLASKAKLLILLAIMSATVFGIRYYGVDYTLPNVLQSPLCVLFCWTAIMAMLGGFKRWADRTTSFTSYMTRSSFGVYIVHMTICSATCILLKQTTLPVWSIYLITIAATFVGSFLLWEILRRVPFVRWCIFGIKAR